jgi:hypothetical protein
MWGYDHSHRIILVFTVLQMAYVKGVDPLLDSFLKSLGNIIPKLYCGKGKMTEEFIANNSTIPAISFLILRMGQRIAAMPEQPIASYNKNFGVSNP